jgi:palmitoyltransferase
MDHHCPWVNNCVGFYNYKFFYLLLVYAAFAELYAIGLLGYTLTNRAGQGFGAWDICAIVTIGLVGLFSLATLGLLGFHTHLILANQARPFIC